VVAIEADALGVMMREQTNADRPAVLTIAGSDSGGGAGLQADLKVFQALGCFGTTAVTCVTAQNPDEVRGVEPLSPAMVSEQINTVCDGFPIAAAKTGMLFSVAIIEAVSDAVAARDLKCLVVDPVMVSTSGSRLLREDAAAALQELVIPKARVITPNLPEAEVLLGHPISSLEDLKRAACDIGERFGVACALKGGHLPVEGDVVASVVDVLYDGGQLDVFSVPRVTIGETHGTGCTFAAVIAAELAKGSRLAMAVRRAQAFVARALTTAYHVGAHTPLGV
jgi:hydroxymethylpyrimidine/phosphomethylpyrimidine kinase